MYSFESSSRTKATLLCVEILVVLFLLSGSYGQEIGAGVDVTRDVMDTCAGAAGPRIVNGIFSPGRTDFASVDDVNGGFCGVKIEQPGIWWWVKGTGDVIKISSCNENTNIKVKLSVFTGSCDALECVTGGDEPDFECPLLKRANELGEWETMSTALTFQSELGKNYYILVQQDAQYQRGTVWLNFRTHSVPQNDNCVDAIGPVPRDMTRITATSVDATISNVHDYCGGEGVPSLYPGTWFQLMGTGNPVTVMSCSLFNFDGYALSVYRGANCDSLECVSGEYEINVSDKKKCSFGTSEIERPMTTYTFDTVDRDRYYVYVHFARTRADRPTADFRFFVDDGSEGEGSTSGAHVILFDDTPAEIRDEKATDNNKPEEKNEETKSSSSIIDPNNRLPLFILLLSFGIHVWS